MPFTSVTSEWIYKFKLLWHSEFPPFLNIFAEWQQYIVHYSFSLRFKQTLAINCKITHNSHKNSSITWRWAKNNTTTNSNDDNLPVTTALVLAHSHHTHSLLDLEKGFAAATITRPQRQLKINFKFISFYCLSSPCRCLSVNLVNSLWPMTVIRVVRTFSTFHFAPVALARFSGICGAKWIKVDSYKMQGTTMEFLHKFSMDKGRRTFGKDNFYAKN